MVGFDHLIAKSLNEVVRQHLGARTVKKIEARLFEKFGISLTQGIEEFEKLDVVLREFFGKGTDGLERKFFENIFQTKLKKSKDAWYHLSDSYVNSVILQAFGDVDKKKVLESVSEEPKIIYDILKDCGLPQTSGYRKINSLIDDGLLIQSGSVLKDNKQVSKYICVFRNLRINIESSKMSVDVQLTQHEQQQSSILKTISV